MSCSTCGESRFQNLAQLECHVYKNHAEFKCSCGKRFMTTASLDQHRNDLKRNRKQCPCSKCCRSFKSEYSLYEHKRSNGHLEEGERDRVSREMGAFFCDDRCGRKFKSADALEDHKRDILGNRNIKSTTCRACVTTFLDNARLSQHRRDTGHCARSTTRVKEYLDYLYKDKIAIDKREKKESVKLFNDIIKDIVEEVRKDGGNKLYAANVHRAGSVAMKTKIGKPDEYDVNIYLNVLNHTTRTTGNVHYKYKMPNPTGGSTNNMNLKPEVVDSLSGKQIPPGYAVLQIGNNSKVPPTMIRNGGLLPREVKRDLYDRITRAVSDKKGIHVNRHAHGPAITASIIQPNDHTISSDITVCIDCNINVSEDGWPRPATKEAFSPTVIDKVKKAGVYLVPKGDEFWLKSYAKAEKAVFENLDSGNGCRKMVNKYLKRYMQDCASKSTEGLPGLSSNILKVKFVYLQYIRTFYAMIRQIK